jgi:hypothetical protein
VQRLAGRHDVHPVASIVCGPSSAWIGIRVSTWSSSVSATSCPGCGCIAIRKAMPESAGIARKNARSDGRLLVEPPSPTTGSVA